MSYLLTHVLAPWLIYTTVFTVAAKGLPAITTQGFRPAMGAAAAFGVANLVLGWLLTLVFKALLFLPALLTFGLAWLAVPFIVNMVLLKVADEATGEALVIRGLPALAQLSAAVTLTGVLMHWFL